MLLLGIAQLLQCRVAVSIDKGKPRKNLPSEGVEVLDESRDMNEVISFEPSVPEEKCQFRVPDTLHFFLRLQLLFYFEGFV